MIPMIHIELQNLREHVVHALTMRNQELVVEVDKAVKAAIDNFDFHAEVRNHATAIIKRAVESSIQSAVAQAFSWDHGAEGPRMQLAKIVKEALVKALTEKPGGHTT